MSETNGSDELESLLSDVTDKPTLNQLLEKMDPTHVAQLHQAVEAELIKRQPPDFANMPEGQFRAYVSALTKQP